MSTQNYRNHRRWAPLYHFFTLPLIIALMVGSGVNLYHSSEANIYSASLICVVSIILFSLYVHSRVFALKVQSRVIRAEENFRHFLITGKPLDTRLRLSQIIALRFASDSQFVELAAQAVSEKLTNDDIKKLIKEWKPDHHRV